MNLKMRSTAAAVATSFGLLTAAPTGAQPRPDALSHLLDMPAQFNIASLTIQTLNPPRAFYETVNTRCILSTGLITRLGDGVIFDNSSIYKVELNKQNLCTLKQAIKIAPNNPQSSNELISYVSGLHPMAGAYLRRESIIPGMPPLPVDGTPRQGIRIPYDLMVGILVAQELKNAGLIQTQPQGQTLPVGWENQTGFIPIGTRGSIRASRLLNGDCNLNVGSQAAVKVAAGSIVIPDTTQAVFIDQQCRVEPLVTIPIQANSNVATIGSGSIQVPLPTNPNIQPAGGAIALAAPETASIVFNGLRLLGGAAFALSNPVGWSVLGGMAVVTGVIAYEAWQAKQASGLSDLEIGALASRGHGVGEKPMGQIQDRNQIKAPGNCTPDQHEALQDEVDRACKGQGARSCSPQTTPSPIAANNISKAMVCIAARQRINNICFMGGNDGHKTEIVQEQRLIEKCTAAINGPTR